MLKEQSKPDRAVEALRRAALRQAGVEESVACKGTPLESATFKVNGRAFLFLKVGRAMVKLDESVPDASTLASHKPQYYKVGSGGWTTVVWKDPKDVSVEHMKKWVGESYRVFASAGTAKKAKHK